MLFCPAVDTQLPQAALMFLNSTLNVIGGLGIIVISTPAVLVALVPLFAMYYRVQVRASRSRVLPLLVASPLHSSGSAGPA